MDLVSHALIGAASASLAAHRSELRIAVLAGAAASLLPDADALIRSDADPLLYIEYHRHFTHSFVFIPVGALLVTALLWVALRKIRESLSFARLYTFCLLGIALHGVLDASTSYGTQLLWPVAKERIAWSVISVFDPLFTLLIAIPAVWAWRRAEPRIAGAALVMCGAYLMLGYWQHQRAIVLMRHHVAEQGLQADRVLVKPTLGNLVLWRGIAANRDFVYVAAVRPAFFGENRTYTGERASRVDVNIVSVAPDSPSRNDLKRFAFFTDDLLSSTAEANRVGDARYAMLPDRLRPIWSVRFDPLMPDRPVEIIIDREMSREDRTHFLKMLAGAL
jgi:inner membrane protein